METHREEHVLSAPKLRLALLTINDLPRVWEQVEPLLVRACEYSAGEMTPLWVLDGMGARDGIVRLHMLAIADEDENVTSIMVVAVNIYPQGRKLDCILTSGENVEEWMPEEARMAAWARSQGCVAVRIPRARKGWTRVLSHWRKLSGATYVMELEI